MLLMHWTPLKGPENALRMAQTLCRVHISNAKPTKGAYLQGKRKRHERGVPGVCNRGGCSESGVGCASPNVRGLGSVIHKEPSPGSATSCGAGAGEARGVAPRPPSAVCGFAPGSEA